MEERTFLFLDCGAPPHPPIQRGGHGLVVEAVHMAHTLIGVCSRLLFREGQQGWGGEDVFLGFPVSYEGKGQPSYWAPPLLFPEDQSLF